MIGGLDETPLTKRYFNASRNYYHDMITFCVQEKKPIPLWQNFFRLCEDPIIYMLFAIMAVTGIFLFYYSHQFEDRPMYDWHRVTMEAIRLMCGWTIGYRPKILPTKILYVSCLFGSLIFTVEFLALFLNLLNTTMFKHQIQSIQEILDQSFQVVGDDFALQHLKKQNTVNN